MYSSQVSSTITLMRLPSPRKGREKAGQRLIEEQGGGTDPVDLIAGNHCQGDLLPSLPSQSQEGLPSFSGKAA